MKNTLSMLLLMLILRVGEGTGYPMLFLSSEEMVVVKKDINIQSMEF